MAAPLPVEEIARELAPYQVALGPDAREKLALYLELLLRWNRRVNLIGLRDPRAIVRTLFGQALFLARVVDLQGRLVDVGSGAGFPGLALKLVAPGLRVTLVEARRKKCAFLREVARACRFSGVDVVPQRFEAWVVGLKAEDKAQIITTRAVDVQEPLLNAMASGLAAQGRVVLFTRKGLAAKIRGRGGNWHWEKEERIPRSEADVLLVGRQS